MNIYSIWLGPSFEVRFFGSVISSNRSLKLCTTHCFWRVSSHPYWVVLQRCSLSRLYLWVKFGIFHFVCYRLKVSKLVPDLTVNLYNIISESWKMCISWWWATKVRQQSLVTAVLEVQNGSSSKYCCGVCVGTAQFHHFSSKFTNYLLLIILNFTFISST